MVASLDQIVIWLLAYKYALLFPISVLEGPIVTIIAGFLVSLGHLNFWLAFIIVVLGDLVGDSILYAIGRNGRNTIIPKYGPRFGLTAERIAQTEKIFGNHSKKTILLGKLTHSLGFAVLITAGVMRQKFGEFILMNFLGTLPKSFALLLVGYYLGKSYNQISVYLDWLVLIIGIILIIAISAYLLLRRYHKNKTPKP